MLMNKPMLIRIPHTGPWLPIEMGDWHPDIRLLFPAI
jgi:hypothetical protein